MELLNDRGEIMDVVYDQKLCLHGKSMADVEEMLNGDTYNVSRP